MKSMKISNGQILIPCPHIPNAKHQAILNCFPRNDMGTWECQYGYSDVHEHTDYEIEEHTTDHMGFDGHYQTSHQIYICGGEQGCGVIIEDADPAEDRAEALADMQIMEALGK